MSNKKLVLMTKKAQAKLRKIIKECGHNLTSLAADSGMKRTTLMNKIAGYRPWFLDEVADVAEALSCAAADIEECPHEWIDAGALVDVIGAKNIMLRGSLKAFEEYY